MRVSVGSLCRHELGGRHLLGRLGEEGHGALGEVAAVGHLPLVMGLDQHRTSQPKQGLRVGEDPDHMRAPLDLLVEPLQRVGRPDLLPVAAWQGHTIAYTGDTEWTETLVELAQGADLLIAEGYSYQRKIRFHLDVATLRQHADRLAAHRVILTHLSAELLPRADELGWETASDGMTVDLPAVQP
jgi:ribonuclease BN (tRNA processing enzyme)